MEAKELLVYQLPAEFIRAMCWVTGIWLIPGLKIKQWIIFDSFYYMSFYLLFYFLFSYFNLGIKAASISYLVSYVILFIMYFIYSVRTIQFKIIKQNIKLILIAIPLLLIGFLASLLNESIGYYFIVPILIFWTFGVIKKDEYRKIKVIIIQKLQQKNK
jgi:hypothetical protein